MALESTPATFDPRNWALLVAGLSLLLHLANFLWTNRIRKASELRDKEIREISIKREQFCEYLQRPINRVLDELDVVAEGLHSIAISGQIGNLDDIAEMNERLSSLHSRLRSNLRKAEKSQFANGSDWDGLTSTAFETAVDKLNAVYNPTFSEAERCASLKHVVTNIGEICSIVRGRLENEISGMLR